GVFQTRPQPREVPLGKKLVAIEVEAPIAGAQLARLVLEAYVPVHRVLGSPLASVDLDLRVQIPDGLVGPISGVALENEDLVCQWQVMPKHREHMKVEVEAVSHEGIQR